MTVFIVHHCRQAHLDRTCIPTATSRVEKLEREDAGNTRKFKPRIVPVQMPTSCFQTTHTKERSGNNSAVTLTQSRKCLPMVALGRWSADAEHHSCPRKSFPAGCRHGNLPKTHGWVQTLPGSQVQGQAEPRTLLVLTTGLLGGTTQG